MGRWSASLRNLTVDWANGNPIPVGGFFYDGGTGGDDALTVIGDGSATGTIVDNDGEVPPPPEETYLYLPLLRH